MLKSIIAMLLVLHASRFAIGQSVLFSVAPIDDHEFMFKIQSRGLEKLLYSNGDIDRYEARIASGKDRDAFVNRASAGKRDRHSKFRFDFEQATKDEFETTAEFELRKSQLKQKMIEAAADVARTEIEAEKHFQSTVTIPERKEFSVLLSLSPEYDADAHEFRCRINTNNYGIKRENGYGLEVHNRTEYFKIHAPGGTPSLLIIKDVPSSEFARQLKPRLKYLRLTGSVDIKRKEERRENTFVEKVRDGFTKTWHDITYDVIFRPNFSASIPDVPLDLHSDLLQVQLIYEPRKSK